jgi:hypothetical protein
MDDRSSIPGRNNDRIFSLRHSTQTESGAQYVPEVLNLGVKWLGREFHHSPLSSAEVKNAWIYTSTTPIRLYGVVFN